MSFIQCVKQFFSNCFDSTTKLHLVQVAPDKHLLNPKKIHPGAKKIISTLTKANFNAYIVGGAIRDCLTGIKPKDFDIATNARPEQIKPLFKGSLIIGRRFKIVHVRDRQHTYEVATFRAASSGKLDKHGFRTHDNGYGKIEHDVLRRDFTINALYYDLENNLLLDYTNGVEDIAAKCIRIIGDPVERFREDPVRILRAARLSAKLDFAIEPNTLAAMESEKSLLANISSERLSLEVQKLFYTGHARQSLAKLKALGLFAILFPETQRALDNERVGKQVQQFLDQACYNADQRYQKGLSLSGAFLYAVLLWWPVKEATRQLRPRDRDYQKRFQQACENVLEKQQKTLRLSKKISEGIMQIWMLQINFNKSDDRGNHRVLNAPRFRAGYDLLLLRAHVNEPVWWQAIKWHAEAEALQSAQN